MFSSRFWLGMAVSILFFGLLFWRMDLDKTVQSFREANYLFVIPGLLLYSIAVAFRTLRWRLLLLPLGHIATRRLFPVVVVGYMANNLLPFRLGELVRSYYIGQREGISKSAAMATIAVERIFDGVTLLFFLVTVSIFLPVAGLVEKLASNTGVPWPLLTTMATVPFAVVLGLLTLIAYRPLWLLRWLGILIIRLPGRARIRILEMAELFTIGLDVLRHPRRLAVLFLMSLPVWLSEAAVYYVIGFSFDLQSSLGGLGSMAAVILAVTATSNLATSLPSSQGGIGPFEFFAAATLVILGVRVETAAAYVITVHVVLLVPVTLLGLSYLWLGKDSLVQVMRIGRKQVIDSPRSSQGEVLNRPEETS